MNQKTDLIITAIAPAIWGTTYYVTTEYLPEGYPLTVAMLRALPVGLLLLLLVRQLPSGRWWFRVLLLGALNFSIFWWLLFVAAYRLPGGVAAIVGAIQPLIVILFSRVLLGTQIRMLAIVAALCGVLGIAVLIVSQQVILDSLGIAAGFMGAVSMAAGTVLSRRWQPEVSLLTFTSWQLVAGGLLLLPAALWFEPALPSLSQNNVLGFGYLGLIGAAFTYVVWFQGVARLDPAVVSSLVLLSPISAVAIGWWLLGEHLSGFQLLGVLMVLVSVWLSQFAARTPVPLTRTVQVKSY